MHFEIADYILHYFTVTQKYDEVIDVYQRTTNDYTCIISFNVLKKKQE